MSDFLGKRKLIKIFFDAKYLSFTKHSINCTIFKIFKEGLSLRGSEGTAKEDSNENNRKMV